MFLLDEVIACAECDEVSIVGGCGNGHAAGAAHVRVTQLISQHLQLICTEVIVIPQHVVVRGSTGPLDASVTAQVEVKLSRMCDSDIDCRPGGDVSTLANLVLAVGTEQPRVVTFLHHDEGDAGLVANL
ncbi:hypothetical protein NP493_830g00026 [Ridgeia piscesae]|uniref:Uncharacterized protein n=1 Tax=Ridgeia piscesae TaxID=27915 RepID=A0AAD9KMG5_RIDPI|nr:hypothetical protein NP493_830g00026 [Ridgeia piscesae]